MQLKCEPGKHRTQNRSAHGAPADSCTELTPIRALSVFLEMPSIRLALTSSAFTQPAALIFSITFDHFRLVVWIPGVQFIDTHSEDFIDEPNSLENSSRSLQARIFKF